jgi:hypothetical protein
LHIQFVANWIANHNIEEGLDDNTFKKEDDKKADMMANKGFTLITVPYWWKNEGRYVIIQLLKHCNALLMH